MNENETLTHRKKLNLNLKWTLQKWKLSKVRKKKWNEQLQVETKISQLIMTTCWRLIIIIIIWRKSERDKWRWNLSINYFIIINIRINVVAKQVQFQVQKLLKIMLINFLQNVFIFFSQVTHWKKNWISFQNIKSFNHHHCYFYLYHRIFLLN